MIEVLGLTKVYKEYVAVDNLTFSVKPGVVTGFLGPNGAGKSTTMRMIVGLDNPTSGSATIKGKSYKELDQPLRTIGTLLDANWIHPSRSAAHHLRWIAATNGISAQRVDEVLDIVGLTEAAGKRAGGFSLGMKQRLGLASALIGDPEVLLLDEPVNGLDPEGIHWIRHLMKKLASEGRTVVVSSHLLSEMSLTADHLLVIGRGKLRADMPTDKFLAKASTNSVYVKTPYVLEITEALRSEGVKYRLGEDGQDLRVQNSTSAFVGDLAASCGIPIHELRPDQTSLEEAFMTLTSDDVQYKSEESAPARVMSS